MPKKSRAIIVDGTLYNNAADAAANFKKARINVSALKTNLSRGIPTYKGFSIAYAAEADAVVDSWRSPEPVHKPGEPLLGPGHVTARTGIYQGLRV